MGSVLYLKATVAYTESAVDGASDAHQSAGVEDGEKRTEGSGTRVQIRIDSKVRDIEHGSTKPTGQFNYTFWVDRDISVMPQTYEEFMIWLDARRRAERVRGSIDAGRVEGVDEGKKGKDDGRRITE